MDTWKDKGMDTWMDGDRLHLQTTDMVTSKHILTQASLAANSPRTIDQSPPLMPSLPKACAFHFRLNPKLLPQGLVACIQFYC